MLLQLASVAGRQRKIVPVTWALIVDDFNLFTAQQRRFITGATLDPISGRLTTSGCPSKPYFAPFQNIIKVVTDATPVGTKADFNFGLDRQFADYASALFEQIEANGPKRRPMSTWKSRDRLGSALFPLASETAPLQAADLLVHITYRMLDDWRKSGRTGQSRPHIYQLLELSLANMRSRADHVFQDRLMLQQMISQAKAIVPHWKDS